MTDPTPQAEQEWFCISCNHPHVMHQNVSNGQSCHCGGCTAWVPELRPAERVIEVAPQGEIPDDHIEHVKVFLNELYATMIDPCAEGEIKVGEMCAALLQAARHQRQWASDQTAALTTMREERDRAQNSIQQFLDHLYIGCCKITDIQKVRFENALKPVSDRQPEGETK